MPDTRDVSGTASRDLTPIMATIAYVVLYAFVTFPLLRSPSDHLLATSGDGFFDMLLFWYAGRGAALQGHVDTLFHPWGVSLFSDQGVPLVPLLSVPLQRVMSLPLAFNCMALGFFVTSGLGMYLLARETGARRAGAFVAGALLLLSPMYLGELAQGILENASLQWLLLFLWLALGLRERPRPEEPGRSEGGQSLPCIPPALPRSLLAGLCLALAALTSAYQAVYAVLFLALLPLRRLGLALGVAALLAAPLLLPTTLHQAGAPKTWNGEVAAGLLQGKLQPVGEARLRFKLPTSEAEVQQDTTRQVLNDSADWAGLLARHRRSMFRDVLPGVLLLVLALLGAWRGGRPLLGWTVMAIVLLVLAMGPYLQWDGHTLCALPTRLLYDYVPMLALPRPTRYLLAAAIPLAVLAAHALPRWRTRSAACATAAALVALQVCEGAFIYDAPYRTTLVSTRVPSFYQRLATDPSSAALVELPLAPFTTHTARHLYYQAIHGRPLLNYDFVRPESMRALGEKARGNSFVRLLLEGSGTVAVEDAPSGLGLRWAVMHRYVAATERAVPEAMVDYFPEDLFDSLLALYGEPRDEGEGLLVFDLGAPLPSAFGPQGKRELRRATVIGLANRVRVDSSSVPTPVATLPRLPSGEAELRAWARGGPAHLEVGTAGSTLVTVSPTPGDDWQWVRVRLVAEARQGGRLAVLVPPGGRAVELFDVHLWAREPVPTAEPGSTREAAPAGPASTTRKERKP